MGAIFLSQNRQVGQRTKHIDVREHFIRRLVENDQVEVKFVKSEDNHADILTLTRDTKVNVTQLQAADITISAELDIIKENVSGSCTPPSPA